MTDTRIMDLVFWVEYLAGCGAVIAVILAVMLAGLRWIDRRDARRDAETLERFGQDVLTRLKEP